MSGSSGKICNLVSSTPFPSRVSSKRPELGDLYDELILSPIIPQQSSDEKIGVPLPTQSTKSIMASKKPTQIAKLSNRRKPDPGLPKESASGVVLKELGVKPKTIRANLSHSRNFYATQAELVVLDSDEEDCMKSVVEIKSTSTKNAKGGSKVKSKADNKVKDSLAVNSTKSDVVNTVKISEHGKGENKQSRPPLARNTRGSKRKMPLGTLENLPETSTVPKSKHATVKQTAKRNQGVASVIDVDDSNAVFRSFTNSGKIQKKKTASTPHFDDIMNDNTIKWTPRSKVDKRKRSSMEPDSLEEVICINTDSPIKMSPKRKITKQLDQTENSDVISNRKEDLNNLNPSKSTKIKPDSVPESDKIKYNPASKRTLDRKTSLQKEPIVSRSGCSHKGEVVADANTDGVAEGVTVSRFGDILFKPNKTSGGIVAKALETSLQRMGYIEIEARMNFSGTISHVTFVVIEGQVKAVSQGVTHILNAGDMIHFKTAAAYKLQNCGSHCTRLLFIKNKVA